MAQGSLLPLAKQLIPTNSWAPGVGYKFYTYAAGTLTAKATYQDPALSAANTNPVIADTRGEVVMYGSGVYRIIAKDANDVTIWDRDNVDTGGYNGYDTGTIFKEQVNRVVDTISALRLLKKADYTRACVLGYYAAGDGGGGTYWYDPTDTTSIDNGGTVVVASDGGRWKLLHGSEVSAEVFGVIPTQTNVGPRLNVALADHVGKYRLRLPQGTLNTGTTVINIPGGCDVIGSGPANTGYGTSMRASTHGTLINSAVAGDYAVKVNAPNATFGPGSQLGQFEIVNTAGKGLYVEGLAAGAHLHHIVVRDCLQEGAVFNYYQDSTLDTIEVINCGGGTSVGIKFYNNCNAVKVDKLFVIQCRQPFLVDGCTFMDFFGSHIEEGEYPSGNPNTNVNTAFIGGGFSVNNSADISFHGGLFVPNSSTFLAAQYSIAESATPFFFGASSSQRTRFIGCKFSSPQHGARFVTADNTDFASCSFYGAATTVVSIQGNNLRFYNCEMDLYDDQSQTTMVLLYCNTATHIDNLTIFCSNPGSATKAAGALIDGPGAYLGSYRVQVDKYCKDVGSTIEYRGPSGHGGKGYSLSGGVIDISKQNAAEAVIINTVSGALLSLTGYHGNGTKYTVVNNTGASLTVGTGGNISTPSPITVPAYGSIDIKHIPGTAALSPVV